MICSYLQTFQLSKTKLSVVQQQIMVFLLLLGRWLLPKDQFSRLELAQLLLILVGSGEDIVEFSTETLSITAVACNKPLVIAILFFWSLSLVQFSIGLPAKIKQSKKCDEKEMNIEALDKWYESVKTLMEKRTSIDIEMQGNFEKPGSGIAISTTGHDGSVSAQNNKMASIKSKLSSKIRTPHLSHGQRTRYKLMYTLYRKDIREALLTIILQDLPFLLIRLYVLNTSFQVSLLFYSLKNIFVIGLHFYRFYAVYREYKNKQVTISPIFDNSFREFVQMECQKNSRTRKCSVTETDIQKRHPRQTKAESVAETDIQKRHKPRKNKAADPTRDPGCNV